MARSFPKTPIRTATQTVPTAWLDYNGHMNVAYYTMAFDRALDEIFDDWLDIGERQAREDRMGPMALQSQIHYLAELREGEDFACDFRLLDHDQKKAHFFVTMINLGTGGEAATYESISMNVDLEARRSAPYTEAALGRLEAMMAAHRDLPRPSRAGAVIGIRRKN
ncbi:MAG: thioesterase family protein [Pseudomonadota bacterium]